MCGIVGYIGHQPAQAVLFSSLERLEYRGYDSSGIAVRGSGITVEKNSVRISELQKITHPHPGTVGIGHTRWATHGIPSALNSHPHMDCTGKIAVVHNGVITNHQSLSNQLKAEGHRFLSETDTEVIPHLIEKFYVSGQLEYAVSRALKEVEGSYAIAVITEDERKLVVARQDSPLVIGIGNHEYFIASDVPALLEYTDRVIFLENGDIGILQDSGMQVINNGETVIRTVQNVCWKNEDARKNGFEHYMIKEICEQPRVIRDTLIANDFNHLWPGRTLPSSLLIVACGTSYHAGCVGEHVLEELTGIPVTVKLASEINYRPHYPAPPEAVFITQSGETADILQAMKRLKEKGTRCLVITNVPNSSASRLADQVLLICAGPEISVAATKSFLGQLMVLYQLALYLYERRPENGWGSLHREMAQLPGKVQSILDNRQPVIDCAVKLAGSQHAFFIGRGSNYAIAQEGALKLKEISYIHAEACPAGELKHGPLALLEHDSPVIAVTSPGFALTAMLTSIKEVKARDAYVVAVGNEYTTELWQEADDVLTVPDTNPLLSPVLNTVILQLLAYYTARIRHCPIDFPRNLAKSVTVE